MNTEFKIKDDLEEEKMMMMFQQKIGKRIRRQARKTQSPKQNAVTGCAQQHTADTCAATTKQKKRRRRIFLPPAVKAGDNPLTS